MAPTIIIGAGPAGLAAAQELQTHGHDYIVLEARDRVGGRVHSVPRNDVYLEYGAAWFHDYEHNELAHFAEQNEDREFKTTFDDTATYVYDLNGRIEPKLVKEASEKLAEFVKSHKDREHGSFDVVSKEFLDKIHDAELKRAARALVNAAPLATGLPLRQISGAAATAAPGRDKAVLGGFENLISLLVAKDVDREKIKYNKIVTDIAHTDSGVTVHTNSGEKFVGANAIVTLPLGVLKENAVKFQPPLSKSIEQSIHELAVGKVEKVYLTFSKPILDNSVFKYIVSNEESPSLVWNFERVHPSKENTETVLVLVSGTIAHEVASLSRSHENAKRAFELVLPILKAVASNVPEPVEVSTSGWSYDQFAKGAFSAVPLGKSREQLVEPFVHGEKTLLFAGEHTIAAGAGFVQGAVASGKRAADEVLKRK